MPFSKILRYGFELVDGPTLLAGQSTDSIFQAVIEMVLDQGSLRIDYGVFDRRELLGDVEAWFLRLDHSDDAAKVPLGTLEPLDDFRMAGVDMVFCHLLINSCGVGTADQRPFGEC